MVKFMKLKLFILITCMLFIGCTAAEYDKFYDEHGNEIKSELKDAIKEAITETQEDGYKFISDSTERTPYEDMGYSNIMIEEVEFGICRNKTTNMIYGVPGGTQIKFGAKQTYYDLGGNQEWQTYLKILTKKGKRIIITGGIKRNRAKIIKKGADPNNPFVKWMNSWRWNGNGSPPIVKNDEIYYVDWESNCTYNWLKDLDECDQIYHCYHLIVEE